ncbi:hypothetical protein ACWD49_26185, partial [Streptomyces sp. NPDC002530]
MSAATSRAVPAALSTATGREAARWLAEHCRAMPWLTAATVGTTVAGAALQVLPVLLLGQVVDGVTGRRQPRLPLNRAVPERARPVRYVNPAHPLPGG